MEFDGFSPVVIVSADRALTTAAGNAVQEAGVQPYYATELSQLDRYESEPKLVVCGADVGAEVLAGLSRLWSCRLLRAALGEGPPEAGLPDKGLHQSLVLPRQSATLIQEVEQMTVVRPDSTRVMVTGAHGGVGASSLAAVIARQLAALGNVTRLVELDPAGAPLAEMLGLGQGGDWPSALDTWGVTWSTLPQWCGVRVLAGLAAVAGVGPAHRLRGVIDQWENLSGAGVTVIDAAPGGSPGAWRVASWCDQVVVVARDCPAGMAAATSVVRQVLTVKDQVTLALRLVKGGAGLATAKHLTGADLVLPLRDERTLPADSAHDLAPGDRPRGAVSRCASGFLSQQLGVRGSKTQMAKLMPKVARAAKPVDRLARAGSRSQLAGATGPADKVAREHDQLTGPESRLARPHDQLTGPESRLASADSRAANLQRTAAKSRRWLRRTALPQFDQRALAEDW
ncbi:MAG: hypothetical protein FWG16_07680 [Micrococcales bacterium]|nr:hypothetical protein [Micrococcales bacterium]